MMQQETKSLSRLLSFAIWCGLAASVGAQEATPQADTETSLEAATADLEPAVDVSAVSTSEAPRVAQRSATPAVQSTTNAIDRLDLGTTSITGNQELPKVLYIVPWKRSDLGNLVGRPVNTLLDEVLAPVDPEVFERHLDYYDTLYGESEQE
jgi:hypothetical protein